MTDINVMVVEDESIIAMDIKDTLLRLGYQVPAVVATGRQAVFKAGECKPDLILMDIRLRGDMDGVTAAEQIKTKYAIPIVFLTAYADNDTLQRAKITEPYGYLMKPFEERDLHTTVEMALYRHRMELRLRDSERYLEATLTGIGEAVIATDNGAHIRFINPAAERLMGIKALAGLGKKLDDLFSIHDRKEDLICVDILERVLRDGRVYATSDETIVIDMQGREIPIAGTVAPIQDEHGARKGVVAAFRDITNRQRAQRQLRDSEERFRRLFEYAPDAYFLIDADGRFLDGNTTAAQMVGYEKEELIGKTIYDTNLISDEEKQFAGEMIQQSLTNGASSPAEYTLLRHDGRKVSVEIRVVPIMLEGKTLIMGIARDITERKFTEEALRESEERLRQVIDLVPHMIYARDQEGRFILANRTVAEIYGVTPQGIIGKSLHGMYRNKIDASQYLKDDREVMESGSPVFIPEERFIHPDGTVHYLQTSKIPIRFAGQSGPAVLGVSVDITERRSAEAALRKSEEKLRAIITNTMDVFYSYTTEGIVTYISPQVSCFGYSPGDVVGHHTSEFIHPDDREFFYDCLNRIFETGNEFPIEFRFLGKDGTVHYAEERGKIIRERGKIARVTGVLRDVTERRRTEETIRRNEEKYRSIFNNFLDVYYEADMIGNIITLSPSVETILGFKVEDAIGRPITDFYYDPKTRGQLLKVLQEHGYANDYEIVLKHRDGYPLPVSVNTKIVHDADGEAIMVQGAFRDITERKRTEKQLRSHLVAMENVSEGMALHDKDGLFTYLNQAHADMYGYNSPLELLGKRWHMLYDDIELSRVLGEIMPVFHKNGSWTGETLGRRKDGSLFPQEISLAILDDGGMICVARDISERKQVEEQQRKLQEQLEKAERMKSLGVLAGGVAHDLNNMLGPLVGYPELILRKLPDDSPVRKQVQRIGNAARDAADVIQDLLTLARRGRYEMAALDINEVVRGYLDSPSFIGLMEKRPDVTVEQYLHDAHYAIQGSIPHLSKVVMNLIVNAFDAMPDGGTLTIITEEVNLQKCPVECIQFEPGPHLALRVRDTGMGIAPEDLNRIFEPYYSKKKMGTSGSGLGLSVVYGIVKDHKGMYDIKSVVGEGTEFILYFPVSGKLTMDETKPDHDLSGRESILIVDDVAEQRDIAVDLLSSLGYQVSAVANGHEAVAFVKEHPVDLLVLDMIMERDFDGLDTYREILSHRASQKAVIISGFSMTDRVREMQKLGAGAYIRKPFTLDDIGSAVRKSLKTPTSVKTV
ncbi:MAG: PAS domain S-box protein [candidate division Zixibacteria bacterium]|nr:PAS domain S-box protein [candidate division Zixibacteria bacterium]